jgi:hypothetical protein
MIALPIASKDHLNDMLVIVLARDDFERIKSADPMQVSWTHMQASLGIKIYEPTIVVCYENESGMFKLMKFLDKKDIIGALKYLQRGMKPILTEPSPIQNNIDGLGKSDRGY